MSITSGFAHAAFLVLYGYTTYYAFAILDLHSALRMKKSTRFDPGQLKYLTIWDLILQTIFFFICLLNDIYGTNKTIPKETPFIRRLKDYFHATFSFPVGMFVGMTFWSLMFVDRELVLPKALDLYFPSWLNHCMHTMIMATTIIEMFIAPRSYPKRALGLGGVIVFMLAYLIWMSVIYWLSGLWVYPVMDALSLPLRVAFILVLLGFTIILYFAGETLNHLAWGNNQLNHQKSHIKAK